MYIYVYICTLYTWTIVNHCSMLKGENWKWVTYSTFPKTWMKGNALMVMKNAILVVAKVGRSFESKGHMYYKVFNIFSGVAEFFYIFFLLYLFYIGLRSNESNVLFLFDIQL